jgi:hypothetical protein
LGSKMMSSCTERRPNGGEHGVCFIVSDSDLNWVMCTLYSAV